MKRRDFSSSILAAILAAPQSTIWASSAPDYPSKPITIFVSFPVGGIIDIQARVIGQKLGEKWNVPVIVQNVPGAGGNIGTAMAFKAEPDGYALLATTPGPMAINQYLFKKLGYEPEKFVPISLMTTFSNLMVVRADLPVNNLKEFIAYAKANPGKITFASQGNGTTSHLSAQMLATMANLELVHVPYKGEGPALIDLAAGRVDMFVGNLASILRHVESKKARLLVVAGKQRVAVVPDIPTSAEAGLPGFEATAWYGIVAAPGTSHAIAQKLSAAINESLKMPDVRERLTSLGAEVVATTPQQFSDWIIEERVRWKRVIDSANISLD